jgi:hypothetical protein
MPKYTLQTQRGRTLTIESDSPENAMRLADQWDIEDHAVSEATRLGVKPDLALRQIQAESGGNPSAVSPKGARGLMQLMPDTAKELGVDPDDPYQNVTGGLTYYKQQVERFGGDERLALAAYNAGPGAVQRYGGIPPYAETQGYVDKLSPSGAARKPPPVGGPALAASVAPKTASPAKPRADQTLGFAKGLMKPLDNAARALEWAADKVGVDDGINALGASLGMPTTQLSMAQTQAFLETQKTKGVVPGKIGEFAGNVAGTLPLGGGAGLMSRPLFAGGASGALLSDADDMKGVATDALIGGVTGRLADLGLSGISKGAGALLGKAKTMTLPQLEAAKRAAYQAVEASGFTFPKAAAQATAGNVEAFLAKKGGKALYPEAAQWVARLKTLANQKGGLPLTQLDDLRGDIYTALVKPGGKDSVIGSKMREEIDGLIKSAADQNALLREARDLNTRWAKANAVTKRLESADLARGRAYTGKNADNTIRQKLSPLIDPMSPQRLRNATADEAAALKKAVTGSKAQNTLRTAGALLDPRGLLGMGLQASMGAKSGGLTLPSILLGYGGTTAANRMSQKNVQELLRLISVGGTKQALKKAPTKASRAVQSGLVSVRPAAVAGAAAGSRDY